jgi:hypothetical protein
LSVKASGGKIWTQDKAKVKQSGGGETMLVELSVIAIFAFAIIFIFIVPIFQSSYGNAEKSSDKDVSLSTPVTHFKDMV